MHRMLWPSLLLVCLVHWSPGLADSSYLQLYPPVDETDERTPLYFALTLSFGGSYKSIGALPGVQIALDYINSEPSILPGYTLHYTLTDSQVEIASFIANRAGWITNNGHSTIDNRAEHRQV